MNTSSLFFFPETPFSGIPPLPLLVEMCGREVLVLAKERIQS